VFVLHDEVLVEEPEGLLRGRRRQADEVCIEVLDDLPPKDLKGLADQIKDRLGSGVVALVSRADGKASVVVAVTDDLIGRVSAVELVRVASEALGGKGGGGRPDMAQAGGPDVSRAEAALAAVEAALATKLQAAAE